MSIFEPRLSFQKLQNAGEGLELLQVLQQVHGGDLVRIRGAKASKNVGLFTSGGQINNSKKKKVCKLIYFECKFKTTTL